MLCSHHLSLVSKHFIILKENSVPVNHSGFVPLSPQVWVTTNFLYVSMLLLLVHKLQPTLLQPHGL